MQPNSRRTNCSLKAWFFSFRRCRKPFLPSMRRTYTSPLSPKPTNAVFHAGNRSAIGSIAPYRRVADATSARARKPGPWARVPCAHASDASARSTSTAYKRRTSTGSTRSNIKSGSRLLRHLLHSLMRIRASLRPRRDPSALQVFHRTTESKPNSRPSVVKYSMSISAK